ncbi:keratin, type I cytoskeletal 18-like [Heterodontus francisci]|uniref:keratin, type I cytoskeletal 18-like n=1 Tax=Heterodontus francisci TaxID=7792 RepID=UPI00355C4D63
MTSFGRKSVSFSSSGGGMVSGGFGMGSSQNISSSMRSSMQPRGYSNYSIQNYGTKSGISLGGAGYQSMGISQGLRGGFRAGVGSSSMSFMSGGLLVTNEKDTMQDLNQRLRLYLEKVRSLEISNSQLEKQIMEFASMKTIDCFDWSVYNTVKPLQQQITDYILQNSRISLEIDNARLAAEDFRNKWESEMMLRQSVENDINGLIQLKETYLEIHGCLSCDIGVLENDIACLRKEHDEHIRILRQQKSQDIQVQVNTAPSIDLGVVLQELRDNYNALVVKNQTDLNTWYQEQVEIQVTQTTQTNQALDGAKSELAQYRQQVQSFEADCNALNGALIALQNTLNDTECRYGMELQGFVTIISQLETDLSCIRNNITRQTQDYNNLVNIKMKLESEIHQYKCLLEGSGQSSIQSGSSSTMMTGSSSTMMTGSSSSMMTGGGSSSMMIGGGSSSMMIGGGSSSMMTGGGSSSMMIGGGSSSMITGGGSSSMMIGGGSSSMITGGGSSSSMISGSHSICDDSPYPIQSGPATTTNVSSCLLLINVHSWEEGITGKVGIDCQPTASDPGVTANVTSGNGERATVFSPNDPHLECDITNRDGLPSNTPRAEPKLSKSEYLDTKEGTMALTEGSPGAPKPERPQLIFAAVISFRHKLLLLHPSTVGVSQPADRMPGPRSTSFDQGLGESNSCITPLPWRDLNPRLQGTSLGLWITSSVTLPLWHHLHCYLRNSADTSGHNC